MANFSGSGTKDDPWVLKTPPGTSEYQMWRDDAADPPAIVCQVGGTRLLYDARAIDDLHAMLKAQGDWVPLGGADEQKPAADGHGRGVGPLRGQPARRLVRAEEGPARPVRRLHAAAAGGARPRRGHPRRQEQPDAGDLGAMARATAAPRRPATRSMRSATRTGGRSSSCWVPGGRSVQELADALPISRPAVSRHLRLLKRAGLVAEEPVGTRRIYRLHDEGIEAVRAYLERVWGDAAARFALVASNTRSPRAPR